jgi:hypothetical protein
MRYYYGRKVVVLIDEYDAAVNHDDQKPFRKALLSDLSAFYGCVFKGNADIKRVILTGCLRIANESIFTGANNPGVFTVRNRVLSTSFGLLETEVEGILADIGRPEKLPEMREWYNGYNFGDEMIYNISDVLSYAKDLTEDGKSEPSNYWANTSGNDILLKSLESPSSSLDMYGLLAGGQMAVAAIDDSIRFDGVGTADSVWSVLCHTGYLTGVLGKPGLWQIPNREIRSLFYGTYLGMLGKAVGKEGVKRFKEALLSLDANEIGARFGDLLLLLSPHDTAGSHEHVYHVFFFGLMLSLEVETNKQAGYGFSDIQIVLSEKAKLAVVVEFKSFDGAKGDKTLEDAANRALRQIIAMNYPHNLKLQGYDVACFGFGCLGRDCKVVGGK